MEEITQEELKAMQAISQDENLPLRFIAEQVWPEHPMHTKWSGGGNKGWVMGRGAILRISKLLKGLAKRGFVVKKWTESKRIRYALTQKGKNILT